MDASTDAPARPRSISEQGFLSAEGRSRCSRATVIQGVWDGVRVSPAQALRPWIFVLLPPILWYREVCARGCQGSVTGSAGNAKNGLLTEEDRGHDSARDVCSGS